MTHLALKLIAALFSLSVLAMAAGAGESGDWKRLLKERLPEYGHRNWIVIADSAYPAQSRDGIETVVSGAGQVEVLQYVLSTLSSSRHVRPNIFLDQELKFLHDSDAPGVDAYRQQLTALLGSRETVSLPHEEIISKLDQAGQTFRVLIIKTDMTVPYTTVFLQLDCAYWSADSERKLRAAMSAAQSSSKNTAK
jgi:L-fucose mutarotase/ribose pyranase (RbsD/FucU family)